MSKMKDIAIDELNDATGIAMQAEILNGQVLQYLDRYKELQRLDDFPPSELEEATSSRLNINTGIVSFIEVSTEKLVVHFG